MEEATFGKMYVRGHDREGRPIIHYTPGEERSFDINKVCRGSREPPLAPSLAVCGPFMRDALLCGLFLFVGSLRGLTGV